MKKVKKKISGKYKEEYVEAVYDYIDSCVDAEIKKVVRDDDKGTTWQHRVKVNIPTIEKLALKLKVCRFTLYNWAEEYPKFKKALEDLRAEQCNKLIQNGLSGDYNPIITKLILSTNHGMKEKSDITTDNKEIKGNTIVYQDYTKSDDSKSEPSVQTTV